jgi:hypothetical protein
MSALYSKDFLSLNSHLQVLARLLFLENTSILKIPFEQEEIAHFIFFESDANT